MAEKDRKQESDSPVETLRIQRTKLTQDEFASRCGIPRATYQRWIAGATEARLTFAQLKALCRELQIKTVEELPSEFSPPSVRNGATQNLEN
ncbi:MAG TPA: helix-turn-helix transcriptional regulator [Kamptonema sp.]|nr:helix-turn-helix transcriptional regulator [Kamptonema sp.]